METNNLEKTVVKAVAFRADVLGLWGFAFATLLDNISALGFWGQSGLMIGTAILLGGIAQIICGFFCNQRDNLSGTITFLSFGLFWLASGLETFLLQLHLLEQPTLLGSGWYLAMWAVFVIMLLIGSLKSDRFLTATLFFVALLLIFKMFGAWLNSSIMNDLGAIAGIISAVMAIYMGMAGYINTMLDKKVLPIA